MKLNGSSGGRHGEPGKRPAQKTGWRDTARKPSRARTASKAGGVFGQETASLPPELQKQIKKAGSSNAGNVRAQRDETRYAKKPAHRKKRRVWPTVLICLLLIAGGGAMAYTIWEKPPDISASGLRMPVVTPNAQTAVPAEETQQPEKTPEPTPEPNLRKDGCYTFLLAAMDQIGANTDVIMVGRMDTAAGTLDIVNIPRDTLVNVSWGVKKVNTILTAVDSDPERFSDKLSDILGFDLDCYAIVNIQAVEKLVDCIGGVYYTVPRNMDYDDPTQDLHVHISGGYQWLSGADAVKVLRFRVGNEGTGYANGDLGRIATQQDFLMSIASQMLTLGNIPNLTEAIDIFQEYVKTDLESGNLAFFARQFLTMDKEKISFSTLPGEGISIRGGSYYEIDLDGWLDIVNRHLNPFTQDISADMLDVLQYEKGTGVYSTAGEVAGGTGSFFDFSSYTG